MFDDLFVWIVSEVSMCFGYTWSALSDTWYANITCICTAQPPAETAPTLTFYI